MRQDRAMTFRRVTLLTAAYAALLIGIGAAHAGYRVDGVYCLAAIIATCFIVRSKGYVALGAMCLCGLLLGLWRGGIFAQQVGGYSSLYQHKITVTVRALNDGMYGSNAQMSFDAGHIMALGQAQTGKLYISGFGLNAVYQGDEIVATGKLYPGYASYQGSMHYAQLQLIGHHPNAVAAFRRKFAAGMQSALPEPLASFAMGLLIGQRATLPDAVKADLLMVGLTHIIAVSGYNLTIMLHASNRLLAKRSKRLKTGLALSLILLFLLVTGASASIVRAAIISVLSIMTAYYGRAMQPFSLVLLAAAITAWFNPWYVWSDISWYLSFLAFFGVIAVAPLLLKQLPKRWQGSLLVGVAIESISAEIMTIPIVLHTFGQVSLIGLPANVIVVTLIPLAMLLSAVAGLAGMGAAAVAGWLAWPSRILLSYMLDIAHLLAHISHVFLQNIGLGTLQMVWLYVCLAVLYAVLKYKTKRRESATITDKNIIVS